VLYESFILDKQQRKQRLLTRLGLPATVPLERAVRGLSRDAYANHVLRVGWEQPTGVLAAALLPCAMFTEIIGNRFADDPPATRPEIAEWVRGYVNECDADMTRRHAELMDEHALVAGSEGRRAMRAEFRRSVEYQTRVFDAAMSLDDDIVTTGRDTPSDPTRSIR
jgi:thiaminase (transcriptional activator TenA)